MYKIRQILVIIASFAACFTARAENLSTMKSPDGALSLSIENDGGSVSYTLSRGDITLVEKSKIGLKTSLGDFSSGITVKSVSEKDINDTFTLPNASQSTINDICREVTVEVNKDSQSASFIFRIYNEGFAWRYVIYGTGQVSVTADAGEVVLPGQDEFLTLPLWQGTRSSFTDTHSDLMECMGTIALPLIAKNEDKYLIVGETAPTKDFCGSRLSLDKGVYSFSMLENITATLPLASPWRTVMAAKLIDIAGSHMIECLADPSAVTNTSWIKPGRAVNPYIGEDHMASYLDRKIVNNYIDWAATQGWEYITLDKQWNLTSSQLKEIISYANSKKIGVFVYKSRASLPTAEGALRAELQIIKQTGAKGLKVEFWEDETLATINYRNMLLSIAAEQQLMVLLSNSVNTAGLSRTWPNLMGTEIGLTNSSYVFSPDLVGACHNINSEIFRAYSGPIDYMPVDFAEHNGKLLQSTTHAHQLALAVVFNSGIQHIADSPDNLRYSISKNVLKSLPANWDDTRWLDASHNEALTVVRRSGSDYYLAAITANQSEIEIPLSFISDGQSVNAYIYRDGSCPTDITFEYKTGLNSSSVLNLSMAKNGGALVHLTADGGKAKPFYSKYEAEGADNSIPFGVSVLTDRDGLCSGGSYVSGAGFGKPIVINNISVPSPGIYAVNVYYMASEANPGSVRLNGSLASIRGLNFINSGGSTGRSLACITVNMQFDKTDGNSLEIASSTILPSIDRITITDNETSVYTNGIDDTTVDIDLFADIYSDDRSVVIKSSQETSYTIHDLLGIKLASGNIEAGTTIVPLDSQGVVIVTLTNSKTSFSKKTLIQ